VTMARHDTRRFRSLSVVTKPVGAPVSLAEAKSHCRIDISEDDIYLTGLVTAAHEYVEMYLDETLIDTEYVMRLDGFPAEIELPRPPMSKTSGRTSVMITYTVGDTGSPVVLASGEYRVDRDAIPGVLRPLYGGSWPSYLLDRNSVTVTWWAGRGANAANVPQRVKAAILMLVGFWYERRLAADAASATEVPFGVRALLDSVKWGSYT
jgi:uncharacterized phiE125 gp8 family phage protein